MNSLEKLQSLYALHVDKEYRKCAGQFFTPAWVAEAMAKWVVNSKTKQVIDPACGFGALLTACRKVGFNGNLKGIELDNNIFTSVKETNPSFIIINDDFFNFKNYRTSSYIVNPPYNRFQNHKISDSTREILKNIVGEDLSGYTNQYAIFLYLIISNLDVGERAAFIVPSEFLATGYGRQVKQFLINSRRLSKLIIFDDSIRVFPDASTTAAILLFDGIECESLFVKYVLSSPENELNNACEDGGLDDCVKVNYFDLEPDLNWQTLGLKKNIQSNFIPLKTFGKVSRGIATGANEFFLLSERELKIKKLENNLIKCISNSSSIKSQIFTNKLWDDLRINGEKCYLFDGLKERNKNSTKYILEGEANSYHTRYLTKSRSPWYRIENRKPAKILVAVFGRDQFKVILNKTDVVNLTSFHGFYALQKYAHFTNFIWLFFQSSLGIESVKNSQRSYGDGLKKLEPGDWNNVLIPDFKLLSKSDIEILENICNIAISSLENDDAVAFDNSILDFEKFVIEKIISI